MLRILYGIWVCFQGFYRAVVRTSGFRFQGSFERILGVILRVPIRVLSGLRVSGGLEGSLQGSIRVA